MIERLKTSIHVNLVFYLIVGSIGLLGLILLVTMHKNKCVPSSLIPISSFYTYFLLLYWSGASLSMF